MRNLLITGGLCLVFVLQLQAKNLDVSMKPFMKVQMWSAFKNNDASAYIRRGRTGLSAKLDDSWTMCACLEFDKIGKDEWAYPDGISSKVNVRLWDLYVSWKPLKDKQLFVVTTGYTLPQLSREAMTKPWFIPSLEKARSSSVLRNFVTGKSSGISPMINAGGIFGQDKLWFEYNLSWIQAGDHYSNANSKANLMAGRLNLGLGSKPDYGYKKLSILPSDANTVVMGLNGSFQGRTLAYDSNGSCGLDLTGNVRALKYSAEYMYLYRTLSQKNLQGNTGFFRLSYNKECKGNKSIEPSLTCSATRFGENEFDVESNLSSSLDAGVDFYCCSKAVKVSFHYTMAAQHTNKIVAKDYSTEAVVLGLQFIFK